LLKGMLVKDAAKEAKLGVKYAQNMVEYSGIKALALQTMAELSKKTGITIINEQLSLKRIADKAEAEGKHSAAVQAHAYLLKSIGGFVDNRPNPDALAGKELDARKMADLRAIADRYYNERYLAAKPIEATIDEPNQGAQNVQGQEQAERSGEGGEGQV